MRELVDQKIDAQLSRAQRYVEAIDAAWSPSAGPPCFLDRELGLNVIDGDELSIFPDQTVFIERLRRRSGHRPAGHPRHHVRHHPRRVSITHPLAEADVERIFERQAGVPRALRLGLATVARTDEGRLAGTGAGPRGPLEGMVGAAAGAGADPSRGCRGQRAAPLRRRIGARRLPRRGGAAHDGEPFVFSFDLPRPLVEAVVAERAVDWSNALPRPAGSGPGGRASSTSSSTTS